MRVAGAIHVAKACMLLLQSLSWRGVECAIHHERDVHEE